MFRDTAAGQHYLNRLEEPHISTDAAARGSYYHIPQEAFSDFAHTQLHKCRLIMRLSLASRDYTYRDKLLCDLSLRIADMFITRPVYARALLRYQHILRCLLRSRQYILVLG